MNTPNENQIKYPCCEKCEIYLDYKDSYQCSDGDCPCHTVESKTYDVPSENDTTFRIGGTNTPQVDKGRQGEECKCFQHNNGGEMVTLVNGCPIHDFLESAKVVEVKEWDIAFQISEIITEILDYRGVYDEGKNFIEDVQERIMPIINNEFQRGLNIGNKTNIVVKGLIDKAIRERDAEIVEKWTDYVKSNVEPKHFNQEWVIAHMKSFINSLSNSRRG